MVAEGGAGGRDIVGVLGAVERRFWFWFCLLGNDVVDGLFHAYILSNKINCLTQQSSYNIHPFIPDSDISYLDEENNKTFL